MKIILLIAICTYTIATERTQVIMGTFGTISIKHDQYIQQGFDLLKNIESKISSYKQNSDISKLNNHQKITPSKYTKEILNLSKEYNQETNGYFDITIGSITKNLYHFGEDESIPAIESIKNSIINSKGIYATHLDHNITIDLGGIGKGYAIDKLATFLQENNISEGIIALSGDIRCLNTCDMSIQSPFKQADIIASFKIIHPNTSISTSGTYNRFIKNQKNHHLINPKIKNQGKDFVSVTLITKNNNTKIDAYATAISVMPLNTALNFLDKHDNIGYILIDSKSHIHIANTDKLISNLTIHPF